jgi:hypothetical protein
MAEFDEVLARIQAQLERMKESLRGKKADYARVADGTREPTSETRRDEKNVPERERGDERDSE